MDEWEISIASLTLRIASDWSAHCGVFARMTWANCLAALRIASYGLRCSSVTR